MKKDLFKTLEKAVGEDITVRRYSLSDMISESYKTFYDCEKGSNLQNLVESHIVDVRENPKDVERLSYQLSMLKEASRMIESNELKDEDLVDKEAYDTVEPNKDRVIQEECGESPKGKRLNDKKKTVDESENLSLKDAKKTVCPECGKDPCECEKGLDEAEDHPELTEEEVEELAKHLEEIRKSKKTVTEECDPKKEVEESVVPRKGIKVSSKRESKKEDLKEDRDPDYELQNMISESISNALYSVLESNGLDPEDDSLMQDFYYAVNIDDLVYDTAKFIEGRLSKVVKESKSYRGLSNFKKLSESKAFYKTFKKLDTKLREGRALTRQESINLYKASNSALTQLSVELEHNPEFLDTFNECTTLLSRDVASLLESLKKGKAPSKKTMKSLAKFSEALLEGVKYPNGMDVPEDSVDLDKALDYQFGTDRDKDNSHYTEEEKQKAINYWIKKTDSMHESEEEDIEDESPEEVVQSEEAEEFDQEYADARQELHDELEDKYEDSEDPEVQSKLEADRVDVAILNGEDPYEEETAEEEITTEEPTEDEDIEDSVDPGEEDITPDELAELKKHLKEMREAKMKEAETVKANRGDYIRVLPSVEDEYVSRGYKTGKTYKVKNIENYGVFVDGFRYIILHGDYEIVPE